MDGKFKTTDKYVWGEEDILFGYQPNHPYTFKLLKPKKGRVGCLSLQYHNQKSETWVVVTGIAWGVTIDDHHIKSYVLRPGEHLTLEAGTIHRLMAITDDTVVAEASTPDAYAADKEVTKDVVRLHCVHGRECQLPNDVFQCKQVLVAIHLTETAISLIEKNEVPEVIKISCNPGDPSLFDL